MLSLNEILETKDDGNRMVHFEYDGIWEEVLDALGEMPLLCLRRHQTAVFPKGTESSVPVSRGFFGPVPPHQWQYSSGSAHRRRAFWCGKWKNASQSPENRAFPGL